MRTRGVLVILAALAVALPLVLANPSPCTGVNADGVQICGICYDCSPVADGVCPSDYGATCSLCDADCGACFEDDLATECNNGFDDDGDGRNNFADATPIGQSCNIACNVANCAAVVPGTVLAQQNLGNPGTPGMLFTDGTLLQPGGPAQKRLDGTGSALASDCWCGVCDSGAGYTWNASSGACERPPTSCAVTTAPTITSFTSAAAPPIYAPGSTVLTLTGTYDASLSVTYEIDTDGNLGNGYEWTCNNPVSGSCSAPVSGLAPGAYTFNGRIRDNCASPPVRTYPTRNVNVTVVNDPPPQILAFNAQVIPVWGGANVNFTFAVSDNLAGYNVTLDYGGGTPASDPSYDDYNVPSLSASYQAASIPVPPSGYGLRRYNPGSFIANLTVTDSSGRSTSQTIPVGAAALPCVVGTQAGAPTYDNDPGQCCTNPAASASCAQQVAGWYSCFARTACSPDNTTICESDASAPAPDYGFVDRDANPTVCETSSVSCAAYTWSDLNVTAACCGDDANEYTASWTYDGASMNNPPTATTNACCSAPGMCFTTAGSAPGCFAGLENNLTLCTDGFDNDCDGLVDAADTNSCFGTIAGTVTLLDQYGNPSFGTQTEIYIETGAKTQAAGGPATYSIDVPAGQHTVSAYKFGYAVGVSQLTVNPSVTITQDFTLTQRKCNADCTNDQGYCDATCIGVGACNPTVGEIQTLQACHPQGSLFGFKPGTEIILGDNGTHYEVGVCCTVPPTWRAAPASTAQENLGIGKIDTLVKFTRLVTLNGKTYKLVISTW